MVEMEGSQVSEEMIVEGIRLAQEASAPVLAIMEQLREQAGQPKVDYPVWEPRAEIVELARERLADQLCAALRTAALGRLARHRAALKRLQNLFRT